VKFRPFEDILAVSHSHGLTSVVVPGAGEANFDSNEANPFANNKQTRETEIQSLLHKLQPEMILLDKSFVGSIDKDQDTLRDEHKLVFNTANEDKDSNKQSAGKKEKHKMRGRNKISAKLRRKQKNVIDAQTVKLGEKKRIAAREAAAKLEIHRGGDGTIARGMAQSKDGGIDALKRFTAGPKEVTRFRAVERTGGRQ
jgi:U3 small nucleolar RNA-associated protein 7